MADEHLLFNETEKTHNILHTTKFHLQLYRDTSTNPRLVLLRTRQRIFFPSPRVVSKSRAPHELSSNHSFSACPESTTMTCVKQESLGVAEREKNRCCITVSRKKNRSCITVRRKEKALVPLVNSARLTPGHCTRILESDYLKGDQNATPPRTPSSPSLTRKRINLRLKKNTRRVKYVL